MAILAVALLGFASLGSCATLVEQVLEVPSGWRQLSDEVNPDQQVSFSFALREPNVDELRTRLLSGESKHLSDDEVRRIRQPDQEDVDTVQKWLAENGIEDARQQNDWIHVRTTVATAEPLLEMKLHRFEFEDGQQALRTTEYTVPDSLKNAVSFVHPIANFMEPRKDMSQPSPAEPDTDSDMSKREEAPGPCYGNTTPECIRKLYKFPAINPDEESTIRLGIAGFLEEYVNYADAFQFLNKRAPDIADTGYNFTVELINGGENPQDPSKSGGEAALDIQYALALAHPVDLVYYYTAGRGVKLGDDGKPLAGDLVDNEPYLEFLEYLLDLPSDEIPHVLSFSYGDDELSVPKPYAEKICNMFGILAGRGTTILSSSGDGGARGSRKSNCVTPEGKKVTMAVFPATCPWVTSIGGVSNYYEPPIGAIFSGGGFSQIFPMEAWQKDVVPEYIERLGSHLKGYYDPSMRAVPDISAVASRFEVVVGGYTKYLDGTSASTPLLASVIALANHERAKKGKDPLGWINQHLYKKEFREALQDTKAGMSTSCPFGPNGGPGGWPATKGWDAITGLGVPNDFSVFVNLLVGI